MNHSFALLDPEHRDMLARLEVVARDKLAPIAEQGASGHVNRALIAALAEHVPPPVSMDGTLPAIDLCVVREALARHCTDAETAFALQGLGADPLVRHGQPALVREWIPRIARGEAVAAFALTEPDAGSDAAAIGLQAQADGDGYRLDGEKLFISNAPEADLYTVFARTSDRRAAGITAFAVPADSAGLSGEPVPLLSDHPIGSLQFDTVRVPNTHVLGAPGQGFAVAMRTLDRFRPSVGACAVGMAQAALDTAVGYAQSRHAFGVPLSRLQGIAHQVADAATQVAAARLLVHAAALTHDGGGGDVTQASAMAKLFATEAAARAIDVAIQVHGARGLQRHTLLEHLFREVRGTRIYEGSSEVQREIIARRLFH